MQRDELEMQRSGSQNGCWHEKGVQCMLIRFTPFFRRMFMFPEQIFLPSTREEALLVWLDREAVFLQIRNCRDVAPGRGPRRELESSS